MQRLEAGMAVFGVSGRRIGVVGEIRDGCFEVKRQREDGGPICITAEALFTVEPRVGVTLVCGRDELARYRCDQHSAPPG